MQAACLAGSRQVQSKGYCADCSERLESGPLWHLSSGLAGVTGNPPCRLQSVHAVRLSKAKLSAQLTEW